MPSSTFSDGNGRCCYRSSWMFRNFIALAVVVLQYEPIGVSSFPTQPKPVRMKPARTSTKNHYFFSPSRLGAVIDKDESKGILPVEEKEALLPMAKVVWVSGSAPSGYGKTSPEPNPTWHAVATQLSKRLPHFAQDMDILGDAVNAETLQPNMFHNVDIVICLGVVTPTEISNVLAALTSQHTPKAVLCDPTCSQEISQRRRAREDYDYFQKSPWNDVLCQIMPWSQTASAKRLLDKTDLLLARKSSEDYLFAVLLALQFVVYPDLAVVKSDINPSWEKGVIRNLQEFRQMVKCCGPQIFQALTDPKSKRAIDLLQACDLRDQVGSYRVIVSHETPQLEAFTLCILQQYNCFQCDAPILTQPQVPLVKTWRGQPLTQEAAKQIFMGHLDHPQGATGLAKRYPWSWKIVVGANPAYDAFPMQHQIFYPQQGNSKSQAMWYDPVFCVETLGNNDDDDNNNNNNDNVTSENHLIWCKRHYRCTPRKNHWSGQVPGAWTLSTLDNGMVSEEHWTTVDVADDLSWAVLHYSGAARRAGQSYVGALLCSADGHWPKEYRSGPGLERIRKAFQQCDLELWELFGGSTTNSFMWSDPYTTWAKNHPPPLERIGDISITTWRQQEREKALQEQQN